MKDINRVGGKNDVNIRSEGLGVTVRDRAEHGVEGVDKLVIERNIVLNEENIVGIHRKKSLFIFLLCESTLDISMIHRIFRSVEWNVLSEGGHVTEGILHHNIIILEEREGGIEQSQL